MKTGFIGYGKAGGSLMKYFRENGIEVSGVYSPNSKAVDFCNFSDIETAVLSSDILFLTITDSKIEDVWNRLLNIGIKDKILCHISGSLTSDVFYGREKVGCCGCSAHPMLAFDSRYVSSEKISRAFFTLEGDNKALSEIMKIMCKCGNRYRIIDKKFKQKYHCAAAIASNLAVGLFYMADKLLTDCGFDENEAVQVLKPIFLANAENVCEKGCVSALTGPVERNDINTVKKHMDCLDGENLRIYKGLSHKLIEISKVKNPHRDYNELKNLLEETK